MLPDADIAISFDNTFASLSLPSQRRPPLRPPSFDVDRFLDRIREFQHVGTPPSLMVQIRVGGVAVAPLAALAEDEIEACLWDLVHALAALRISLVHTDHLSDAELYTALTESLGEPAVEVAPSGAVLRHRYFDLVDCSEGRDLETWLRFYADDEVRAFWAERWSADSFPVKEELPHDRDACLPGGW